MSTALISPDFGLGTWIRSGLYLKLLSHQQVPVLYCTDCMFLLLLNISFFLTAFGVLFTAAFKQYTMIKLVKILDFAQKKNPKISKNDFPEKNFSSSQFLNYDRFPKGLLVSR